MKTSEKKILDERIIKYLNREAIYSDSILYNPNETQYKLTKSLKRLVDNSFHKMLNYGKSRGFSRKQISKFIKQISLEMKNENHQKI